MSLQQLNLDGLDSGELDFDKMQGLVPAIIQHAETAEVLMLGFMNRDALNETIQSGYVTFWSRSKKRLWKKGETSNHTLALVSVACDCDRDTLLIQAIPNGAVCHQGTRTCFVSEV